ncbi:hypothetical protein [Embleya sp. NPDC020886]|uniref:hypothetical protein n=1 Tax=Embleya sp. NPDC020886 TaxID=3363980 RepID=UPI0037A67A45
MLAPFVRVEADVWARGLPLIGAGIVLGVFAAVRRSRQSPNENDSHTGEPAA